MKPSRIPLTGGTCLNIGPGRSAQIADRALEHATIQRLAEEGAIELLGDGERTQGSTGPAGNRAQTTGQGKSPFRRRQGER